MDDKRLVKYFVQNDNGTYIIWIQNHSQKKAYFKTDDEALVKQKCVEIEEDIKKVKDSANRIEVLLGLYKFARDRGCICVWKQRGASTGVLKMKPEPSGDWILILARGKQEIILHRDTMQVVKEKYFHLLDLRKKDSNIYAAIWDYAMAKQKLG